MAKVLEDYRGIEIWEYASNYRMWLPEGAHFENHSVDTLKRIVDDALDPSPGKKVILFDYAFGKFRPLLYELLRWEPNFFSNGGIWVARSGNTIALIQDGDAIYDFNESSLKQIEDNYFKMADEQEQIRKKYMGLSESIVRKLKKISKQELKTASRLMRTEHE